MQTTLQHFLPCSAQFLTASSVVYRGLRNDFDACSCLSGTFVKSFGKRFSKEPWKTVFQTALEKAFPKTLENGFPKALENGFPKDLEKAFPKALENGFPKALEKAFPKTLERVFPKIRNGRKIDLKKFQLVFDRFDKKP